MPLRLVLDTNVIVSAVRSPQGASGRLLRACFTGGVAPAVTTALFLEYEAVLKRDEHLVAARLQIADIDALLSTLAIMAHPVTVAYRWRPILLDPADEMVLEAALSAAAPIVTSNARDFHEAERIFGTEVLSPVTALRRMVRLEWRT